MRRPLMPKATAVWLVENTSLAFQQISDFCGMHLLEIQAIADGDVSVHIMGLDPVVGGQLTREEIARCEKDVHASLQIIEHDDVGCGAKKSVKYTPVAKRADRPKAIAWLLKNHPEMEDLQIVKLIRTTRPMIESIRNKTYKKIEEVEAESPVFLGLCSQDELDRAVAVSVKIISVDK